MTLPIEIIRQKNFQVICCKWREFAVGMDGTMYIYRLYCLYMSL